MGTEFEEVVLCVEDQYGPRECRARVQDWPWIRCILEQFYEMPGRAPTYKSYPLCAVSTQRVSIDFEWVHPKAREDIRIPSPRAQSQFPAPLVVLQVRIAPPFSWLFPSSGRQEIGFLRSSTQSDVIQRNKYCLCIPSTVASFTAEHFDRNFDNCDVS